MRNLMMLFMILLAVLCRVRSKSKPPPPPPTDGGPPAPPPDIKDYCETDIKEFCPGHRNSWLILCLYENKSQLSKKCQSYLGTTTIGGCNNEATNLCPDQTNVDDIYNCLDQHRDKLGQACVLNLANRNATSTAMNSAQEEYKRITFTVTAISAVYLSIPLCLCLLAGMYMSSLLHEQDTVLAEGVDTWMASTQKATNLPNSGVPSGHSFSSSHTTRSSPHNATESQLSTEIDSVAVNTITHSSSSPRAWTIGFHQLSYWTPEKTDWMGNKLPKQQILKEISGEFRSSAVSAIMGPSGSGKTTLLQLVGGQMASGEFSGTRVINNTRPSAKVYDKVLRGQGYVSQQDTLLQSLTVWQTLVYCALLKLPIHMARKDKLYQAARIMNETGLVPIARNVIGSASGGSEGGGVVQKGISGGQRRRLSIALELIGGPAVLLLDEPTSGLDSSSSLRVVTLLQRMSRKLHTTIALTIHQPRAEVFGLFDSLLLLGTGGHLIYSGPSVSAAAFLSTCSAVRLPLSSYDNPGDFIIDILGLETSAGEEEERVLLSSDRQHRLLDAANGGERNHCSSSNTNVSGDIEQLHVSTSISQLCNNQEDDCRALTAQLSRHFLQSAQFTALQQQFRPENITELVADSSDNRSTAWRTVQLFSLSGGGDATRTRNFMNNRTTYNPLSSSSAHGTEPADNEEGVEMTSSSSSSGGTGTAAGDSQLIAKKSSEDSLVTDDHSPLLDRQSSSITTNDVASSVSGTLSEKEWLTSYDHRVALPIWMQVPVLFSRRVQTIAPSRYQFSMLALQILGVAAVVTRTFSYRTSTEFERPYQVVMLLSILCLYAMILQYLLLIPEYMAERGVIVREYSCGCVSYHAYILSVLLTEVPRALVQCVVLVAVLYTMHPLNDDRVNVLFCVVCLVVGVTAWQALICLCSVMTDAISVAYTAVFLILGSGTLFGGLLVRLQKIPVYFRFLYYVSVAAVTQRALVTNDMQCCYLTTTCNGIAKDFQTSSALSNPITVGSFDNFSVTMTTFCPPGLQFTGDGSDVGNLGKVYLVMLGLDEDHPFVSLLLLFLAAVFYRLVAVRVLQWRSDGKFNARHISSTVVE